MACLPLWSATSVTEHVFTTHTSASSLAFARAYPRSNRVLPIALLSAKFSLHPNVTNRIVIHKKSEKNCKDNVFLWQMQEVGESFLCTDLYFCQNCSTFADESVEKNMNGNE